MTAIKSSVMNERVTLHTLDTYMYMRPTFQVFKGWITISNG